MEYINVIAFYFVKHTIFTRFISIIKATGKHHMKEGSRMTMSITVNGQKK